MTTGQPERGGSSVPPGLTAAEAARQLVQDGPNELPAERRRGLLRQAWSVIREPMLLLLLAAGAINLLLAEPLDAAILLSFVVLVIGISIYQQHRTENALTALRDLSSPRALVIRDGQRIRVPGREVVLGDAIVLNEGDRIPADGVLLEGVNLLADESALTGESVPVTKATREGVVEMGPPGGEGMPWLFSGTLVVGGHGIYEVLGTGSSTELGRIGAALHGIESSRTRLQREFDRLVVVFAVLGGVAAMVVLVVYGLTRGNWLEGALAGITTAMAVLPEEFPVVFSVFLAMGAWRMSRRNVLARRPAVIETLGSATVVCVDKTGTLTLNQMSVREVTQGSERYVLDHRLPDRLDPIVRMGALACPERPFDPMDRAFTALADEALGAWRPPSGSLVREYPLSSAQLSMAHAWRADDGSVTIAVKGAPEAIVCLARLSDAARDRALRAVEAASGDGLRMIAVGRAHLPPNAPLPESQEDMSVEFLGFAGLQDPVRPGVPEAVAECARAGVRTVMITGDYPGTALAIAREIGIPSEAGCVSGPELAQMSDVELADAAQRVSVFARMVPEQKLRLVRALQEDGEVVGMTGDGVNDAPALRASDIGIAMGGRGTDVARESADLVVVDDDFASITSGIRQGRGIFANLRKALTYVIAVHIPIYGMALIPVFVADWPLVLMPIEVALLELIIDPACSVVFEAEPVDPAVMDERPRPLTSSMFGRRELLLALVQGSVLLAVVFGLYVATMAAGLSDEVVRTMTFVALVAGNVGLILVNRSRSTSALGALLRRRNPALLAVIVSAAILLGILVLVPAVRDALQLGFLLPGQWALAVGVGVVGVAWFEVARRVGRAAPVGRARGIRPREPRRAGARPLR
ncbi:MAG: cation-translocating P-type ATPase [Candidatus Nanopelagicales bacterium]